MAYAFAHVIFQDAGSTILYGCGHRSRSAGERALECLKWLVAVCL